MHKKDHGLEALEYLLRILKASRYGTPSTIFPALIDELEARLAEVKLMEEESDG